MCRTSNKLITSYLSYEGDNSFFSYKDEILTLKAFSVRCTSYLAPLTLDVLKKEGNDEVMQRVVRGIKTTIFDIYRDSLMNMNFADSGNANALRLAEALAASSEQYLPFMSLEDREKVTLFAKLIQKSAEPDVRSQLDKIITTLSSKECGWACQLEM